MIGWSRRLLRVALAVVLPLAVELVGTGASAAVIFVTTTVQKIDNTVPGCSLQEAIYSANFDFNFAISGYDEFGGNTPHVIVTECLPGSGADIIILPSGASFKFNKAVADSENPAGPTATPMIASNITIEARGSTLEFVSPTPAVHCHLFKTTGPCTPAGFRLFTINELGTLTLRNAYVKNFLAQGGSGFAGGGGGGMGAGGAIFVMRGGLVVENSTFSGNNAVGGNGGGSAGDGDQGAGGGGMYGHGGPGSCDFSLLDGFGGGGGGSRGDGMGSCAGPGGGTVFNATNSAPGFACGGESGFPDSAGHDAPCPGGGGGGGGSGAAPFASGAGGNGNYGGGGGGGGKAGDGGNGGFGGGGGAGWRGSVVSADGGNAGFGGGGGAGPNGSVTNGDAGNGGKFGGVATHSIGGGGAGLGGAVFSDNGRMVFRNSTFTLNDAVGGRKGGDPNASGGGTGDGHGGAIFSLNGRTTLENVTVAGNLATGSGGGVYIYQEPANPTTTFILRNTIIANNGGSTSAAASQCVMDAHLLSGSDWQGNLIQNNDASQPCDHPTTSGVVSTADPQLGPLQYNQGPTPTMAISSNSPARNAADAATSRASDQRGQARPANGGFDIGAFELCFVGPAIFQMPCIITGGILEGNDTTTLTMAVSPTGGGVTTPPVGSSTVPLNSVIIIKATPNAGFRFTGWSSNVTTPGAPSTNVVMDQAKVVTANFTACACATDVTSSIKLTFGGITVNPITKRYVQTVSMTNIGGATITGPISLVLDNLTATVSLFGASGTTSLMLPAGSPYMNANVNLAPGQSANVVLQFTNTGNVPISYDSRVLAGAGAR